MTKIELEIEDRDNLEIFSDEHGYYFLIDGIKAILPVHAVEGNQLTAHDCLTFFIEHLDDLTVNIMASYIYEMIARKKTKAVRVNGGDPGVEKEQIVNKLNEAAKN